MIAGIFGLIGAAFRGAAAYGQARESLLKAKRRHWLGSLMADQLKSSKGS
jgi:hypothetical protein